MLYLGGLSMDLLTRARDYVAKNTIPNDKKCEVHLTPETGWLNDPNGFSYFNGKYHMFYQFYPYAPAWNRMHWGHAVSDDCIKWEYEKVALAPLYPLVNGNACYSGSAIEHEGKHYLMFTQNGIGQKQCLAYSEDGVDYKRVLQPVINAKNLPKYATIFNFRDPKVWKKDNKFYVLLGAMTKGAMANCNVLLFSSDNLYDWNFVGPLFEPAFCNEHFYDMAECPDFFTIGDKDVLIVSPWRKQKVVYMVGKLDYATGKFECGDVELVDHGTDYFATQSITNQQGKVMMTAWVQPTISASSTMKPYGWNGLLTLPREVTLRDNKMYQMPPETLKNYRTASESFNGELSANKKMDIAGDVLDIELEFSQAKNGDGIILYAGEDKGLSIYYDNGNLIIDRTHNYTNKVLSQQEYKVQSKVVGGQDKLTLRIVLDRFSLEVFVNEGAKAFSTLVAPTKERLGVVLKTAQGTNCKATVYKLN